MRQDPSIDINTFSMRSIAPYTPETWRYAPENELFTPTTSRVHCFTGLHLLEISANVQIYGLHNFTGLVQRDSTRVNLLYAEFNVFSANLID